MECIDEALSVLGNEPRQALYQYLLTICSLPREEIPGRVADFAAGLRKSLGGASKVIERIILRKLFQKTGSSFRETTDTEFTEYVADAKRRYEILSHRHGIAEDSTDPVRSKKGQVTG
ncbi:MAG: hypothetical protein AUI95_02565 [Crenarchaeota archaeon 13_1_40CM_3_52_4]|nr:MAG: hypothetical protein AUI95_02565 [Crenarchaeota archaeon 13_1_40CM_3_52_4]